MNFHQKDMKRINSRLSRLGGQNIEWAQNPDFPDEYVVKATFQTDIRRYPSVTRIFYKIADIHYFLRCYTGRIVKT